MSRFVIFFIGVIFVVGPKNVDGSISIQDLDVQKLVELLQQQEGQHSSSSSSDDDDSDGFSMNGGLADMINKIIDGQLNKRGEPHLEDFLRPNSEVAKLLEHLLNKRPKDTDYKQQLIGRSYKKPTRLVWDGGNNKKDDAGLEEYSKIYILLNPQVMEKNKASKTEKLNNLISKILSLSASSGKNEPSKPKRYKGFLLRDNAKRRRNSS